MYANCTLANAALVLTVNDTKQHNVSDLGLNYALSLEQMKCRFVCASLFTDHHVDVTKYETKL